MISLDLRTIAEELGGEAHCGYALLPGPGHSRKDRSLLVRIDPSAPEGFFTRSFSTDSTAECRDYVRNALRLTSPERRRGRRPFSRSPSVASSGDHASRIKAALRIWSGATDPRDTMVADYLASRCLVMPEDMAMNVIRFDATARLDGAGVGAMVALFRDIMTNEPCGVHRTYLDASGRKIGRRMLGRSRHAAIKLDADESVTTRLHIGEGIETCLGACLASRTPVWALGSASAISAFPVLAGIEAISILGERNDHGANERAVGACGARWATAGRQVLVIQPLVGDDFNDVWRDMV